MKKILILSVVAMIFLSALAAAAEAASDKIGFIDSARILAAHPKYEESRRYLENFHAQKADEARVAAERESDPTKRMEIIDLARHASGQEEMRIMNPITMDIDRVIQMVAQSKGVTVVIERTFIYFGGVDLTEDIVKGVSALK